MTKDQVLQSKELKSLFVQDNDLPITVLEEPYFSQRLIILDPVFHCRMAFKRFCDELGKDATVNCYLNRRERTVWEAYRRITDDLESSWHELDTVYFEKLLGDIPILLKEDKVSDFYNCFNSTKVFLRVRLRNGYLTAFHRFQPDAVQTDSWDMLLDGLDSHLRGSGIVQRKLFSILGVGRLAQLTQCYLSLEAEKIRMKFGLEPSYVFPGELLYELGPDSGVKYSDLNNVLDPTTSAEIYRLTNLKSIGFLEEFMAGSKVPIRFVQVDPNIIHQLVTYYFRDTLMNDDLVINYNGRLATMHEAVENPWR